MKILFYDTKSYDRESFDAALPDFPQITLEYTPHDLDLRTASLADGFDAVCGFVSSDISEYVLDRLHTCGVRLILLRCAGFNNVNVPHALELGMRILRVPGYSPEAVAEHAMALALACNRKLCKAYNRVRENDFSLAGLMGTTLYQKTAGIIGTGKIGAAMCRICHGFGMEVTAYDVYPNENLAGFVRYVSLEELLSRSDMISLHCPLTDSTRHLICLDTIRQMKDGVLLVNTSRGGLVDTANLIEGIRLHKFAGVGLDVYEEEAGNVFEDRSDEILESSITARLLSFPNVVITSHQGFFTREALQSIASTTLENAMAFLENRTDVNDVTLDSL